MINALRDLRDLLDGIERDGDDFDQGAMNAAIAIVERLIVAHEPPLPIPAVNSVYSVPTPYSPASAPPPPPPPPPQQQQKSRRPRSQHFEIKRKSA